jgi:uncharacterized membrane protein
MDAMVPDEVTRRILARYEAAELITACAWCQRVDFDGDWPLVPRAALAAIDQHNTLTHSICPSCMAAFPSRAA